MKKIFSTFCLIFCLPLLFCGILFSFNFFASYNTTSADTSGTTRAFDSASYFVQFINNSYATNGASFADDTITIITDLDFSGYTFTSTLGTSANPFCGTFDAQGHTLSNITLSLSSSDDVYAGFFGVTNGATISNLKLTGTYSITVTPTSSTYIGMVVGMAENTTIENLHILSSLSVSTGTSSFQNLTFGMIAGYLSSSTLSYAVVSSSSYATLTFDNIYSSTAMVGGIVGSMNNSKVMFCVTNQTIACTLSADFSGSVYVGGIFGSVSAAGSLVTNCVIENKYSITDNANSCYAGIVGGCISTPAPSSFNISYIYFLSNSSTSSMETFGSRGSYSADDGSAYIASVSSSFSSQSNFDACEWNPRYGDYWDFDNIWTIYNNFAMHQVFAGTISASLTLDSELTLVSGLNSTYAYNETATFSFKITTASKYYTLSNIKIKSTVSAVFYNDGNGYYLSTQSGYSRISLEVSDDDEPTYTVTINGMTSHYSGAYSVTVEAVKFTGLFEYRLFDKNGALVEEDNGEAYVYYLNGSTQTNVSINNLTYGYSTTVTTSKKANSIYAFGGWYLSVENGEDILLSSATNYTFTFGQDNLTDSFTVYARYDANACVITFVIDSGVAKIELGTGATIEETGATVSVLKESATLKMTVVLAKGHSLDVDTFTANLNIYKVKDATISFVELTSTEENDETGEVSYVFTFNLSNLNDDDFIDGFTITVETTQDTSFNMTTLWIIIGSVLGVLVLAGLIVLIIFLVKRRGGGYGGGGRTSFKKGMYF